MTESTIQPEEIYIDKIINGRVHIFCRWNIEQITKTDDFGKQLIWQYDETIIWWTFPYVDSDITLDNVETIESYILKNKDEILNFAKGVSITIDNAPKKIADARALRKPKVIIKKMMDV